MFLSKVCMHNTYQITNSRKIINFCQLFNPNVIIVQVLYILGKLR